MLPRYDYIRGLWEKGLEAEAREEEALLTKEFAEPMRMFQEGLTSATEFAGVIVVLTLTPYKDIATNEPVAFEKQI